MGQARLAGSGLVDSNGMVITMTSNEIKAAFAHAKAQSYETLERVADVEVVHRSHHDDDALLAWRRKMPAPAPVPTLTSADVHQMILDHFAHPARLDEEGKFVSAERKRWRGELDKLRRSFNEDILTQKRALLRDFNRHRNVTRNELEDARQRIAELQRKVDDLTFEKTFATSKIIDLPAFPLRSAGARCRGSDHPALCQHPPAQSRRRRTGRVRA
jgi:hypothetical protein